MTSTSKSPTDEAQILMFLDLVDQYDHLAAVLPQPDPGERSDFRVVLIRSFMLRKFATKSDNAYLPRTTNALSRLCPGRVEDGAEDEFNRAAAISGGLQMVHNGKPEAPADVWRDLLYGSHLHGDYGRWCNSRNKAAFVNEWSTRAWVRQMDTVVHRVRGFILKLVTEGDLVLGDDAIEPVAR